MTARRQRAVKATQGLRVDNARLLAQVETLTAQRDHADRAYVTLEDVLARSSEQLSVAEREIATLKADTALRGALTQLLPLAAVEARRRHNQDRDQELDRDGHPLALGHRHPGRFETCPQSECALTRIALSGSPVPPPAIPYPDPCFVCPTCGPTLVDEDGCCVTCGADAPVSSLPASSGRDSAKLDNPRAERMATIARSALAASPRLITMGSTPKGQEPPETVVVDLPASCLDCGMAYGGEDWVDVTLSDVQWHMIHPTVDGVLCANCIVRRVARVPQNHYPVTAIRAVIEFGSLKAPRIYPPPFGQESRCICPDSWRRTRPRNHTDECASAYEQQRSAQRTPDPLEGLDHGGKP